MPMGPSGDYRGPSAYKKFPLVYLDNHLDDRAETWYTRMDPPAKVFALVKSGIHLHVRTCHVHNSSKNPFLYFDNHLADRA